MPASKKRKKKPHERRQRPPRQPGDLHTIETFCAANQMSMSFYYTLRHLGKGPKEIKIGKRIFITPEAEAEWRRDRAND